MWNRKRKSELKEETIQIYLEIYFKVKRTVICESNMDAGQFVMFHISFENNFTKKKRKEKKKSKIKTKAKQKQNKNQTETTPKKAKQDPCKKIRMNNGTTNEKKKRDNFFVNRYLTSKFKTEIYLKVSMIYMY